MCTVLCIQHVCVHTVHNIAALCTCLIIQSVLFSSRKWDFNSPGSNNCIWDSKHTYIATYITEQRNNTWLVTACFVLSSNLIFLSFSEIIITLLMTAIAVIIIMTIIQVASCIFIRSKKYKKRKSNIRPTCTCIFAWSCALIQLCLQKLLSLHLLILNMAVKPMSIFKHYV